MKKRTLVIFCFLEFLFNMDNLHASEYHNYINRAEICIVINQPAEALKFYEIAFSKVEYPLAKDLNNALLISIKEKYNEEAIKFAIELAQKGVGPQFFLENKKLESLKVKDNEWKKIIEIATTSKKFINRENKEVLDQIDSLVSRSDKAKKELRYIDFHKKELRQKTVSKLYRCGSSLQMIFRKYGYLSEEYIGVAMLNDTTINPLPSFAVILKNQTLFTEFGYYDLTEINKYLYSALHDDQIDPQVYAIFQSDQITSDLGIFSYFELNNKLYTKKYFDKLDINKKRREIPLCNIEESLKKTNFLLCNPKTPFIILEYSLYIPNEVNHEEIVTHPENYKVLVASFPVCGRL